MAARCGHIIGEVQRPQRPLFAIRRFQDRRKRSRISFMKAPSLLPECPGLMSSSMTIWQPCGDISARFALNRLNNCMRVNMRIVFRAFLRVGAHGQWPRYFALEGVGAQAAFSMAIE